MSANFDILTGHPLFSLMLTVGIYGLAVALYNACGTPALLHPVLTATAAVAVFLMITGTEYEAYFRKAWPLHEALGIFVVLLAVALHRRLSLIVAAGNVIGITLLFGSVVGLGTAVTVPLLDTAPRDLLATLAPKSATAAVSVQIAEVHGGAAALTAVVTIASGIFGGAFGPWLLAAVGVRDHRAVGLALGIASHGIGTARALQISGTAGAFASIGMILNALLTIALVSCLMAFV